MNTLGTMSETIQVGNHPKTFYIEILQNRYILYKAFLELFNVFFFGRFCIITSMLPIYLMSSVSAV